MVAADLTQLDPRVREWIEALGPDRWAGLVLDADDNLVWVSDEMMAFLGETDPDRIGIGSHFVAALLSPTWRDTMLPESQVEIFEQALPRFRGDLADDVIAALPPPFDELIAGIDAQPRLPLVAGGFGYVQDGLPPYRVEYLVFELHDETGGRIGSVGITTQGARPTLWALLARGDGDMYERMSRLVQPGKHAAAVLFAALEASGELSRQLPTSRYFEVVRELATSFDTFVADDGGIVGKHVGDGMTAFFLAEDAGSASGAAAAGIDVACRLRDATLELGERLAAEGVRLTRSPQIRAGLHFGPSLYLR